MVSFIIDLDRSYISHILIWILPCNAMALVGFIGLFMGSNLHTKQLPFGGSIMVAEAVFLIGNFMGRFEGFSPSHIIEGNL